jgi:uncharacterized membrane protein YfcA
VLTTLNAAAVLYGTLVGLALGLTGIGSVFAVPFLVYGLRLGPHAAVCVSMAAVAAMALVVSVRKSRLGLIKVPVGAAVATGGALGAPVGVWLNKQLSPNLLLVLFAVLAAGMGLWTLFTGKTSESNGAQSLSLPQARLQSIFAQLTLMTFVGVIAGVLSGMLGVGGGFFIIPALLFFGGLEIHSAIATSLPVVVLISAVAMTGHLVAGQRPPLELTGLFAAGGVVGVELGSRLGARLDRSKLERVFGVAVLTIAILIALRNLHGI